MPTSNCSLPVAIIFWALLFSPPSLLAEEIPQFNRDVRPILSRSCFACHGPDKQQREGGFRLDIEASAKGIAASGSRAIVPTDLTRSELIRRIESQDDGERMPPLDSREALSDAEKDILRRWVAAGAAYETHWAFTGPLRRSPPTVVDATWSRNPIDSFILAKLEREGIHPSPEAKRETLIRRVTLDLTGLPATPAEIDAYLVDGEEGAYERVVNRLMMSKAYAERRTQDWLDLARYADTRGFADDKPRNIWPYRDWVIRSLHNNMPFDQFTIEQLAGDMLPDATDEQRLATAFHRNAPQAKGNTYPVEEYRVKGVVDRVNTTARVWLGITVGCAECHDHKFDPITQRDYYAMFAVFNQIEHGGVGFDQGGPTMQYRGQPSTREIQLIANRKRLRKELRDARSMSPPMQVAIDGEALLGEWKGYAVIDDPGKFSVTGDMTVTAKIKTDEAIGDIASKYDWRGEQRSFVFGIGGEGEENAAPGHLFAWFSSRTHPFEGVEIYGSQPVNDGREHLVAVSFAAGQSVRLFVDGIEDTSAKVVGKPPPSIAKSDRKLAIGAGYSGAQEARSYRFTGELEQVRIYNQAVPTTQKLTKNQAVFAKLQTTLAQVEAELNRAVNLVPNVPIMRERSKPRDTFIHVRGDFLRHGERVSPGVPEFLRNSTGKQIGNRLEFARWLVSEANPLVARVVVNRFWQGYFGHGLVATPDDFGLHGAMPTHPELLDWLASEFVRSGWDRKHIHRLIVTSATYRQSARIPAKLLDRDPANVLIARMPRIRLPAEQIRDQALSVSGLLARKVGGPSVFPRHPADYWRQRALPGTWKESGGQAMHRRTLYTYWRRMALHPSLELLDAPAREICVARRNVSNVPTQALVLLNDPIFTEASYAFAKRLMDAEDDTSSRLNLGFRFVLGRLPDAAEHRRFLAFLDRERRESGEEHAWMLTASVLLNLDETVTRP